MSREDIFDVYERETYDDTDKPKELKIAPEYCRECGDEIHIEGEDLCGFCTETLYYKD